jgi:hypothetical protein
MEADTTTNTASQHEKPKSGVARKLVLSPEKNTAKRAKVDADPSPFSFTDQLYLIALKQAQQGNFEVLQHLLGNEKNAVDAVAMTVDGLSAEELVKNSSSDLSAHLQSMVYPSAAATSSSLPPASPTGLDEVLNQLRELRHQHEMLLATVVGPTPPPSPPGSPPGPAGGPSPPPSPQPLAFALADISGRLAAQEARQTQLELEELRKTLDAAKKANVPLVDLCFAPPATYKFGTGEKYKSAVELVESVLATASNTVIRVTTCSRAIMYKSTQRDGSIREEMRIVATIDPKDRPKLFSCRGSLPDDIRLMDHLSADQRRYRNATAAYIRSPEFQNKIKGKDLRIRWDAHQAYVWDPTARRALGPIFPPPTFLAAPPRAA